MTPSAVVPRWAIRSGAWLSLNLTRAWKSECFRRGQKL
jgi:hypothetical protein